MIQLNTVYSRSSIFLVLHFQSHIFHPCIFGPAFSSTAFLIPQTWHHWSHIFWSHIFSTPIGLVSIQVFMLWVPGPRFQTWSKRWNQNATHHKYTTHHSPGQIATSVVISQFSSTLNKCWSEQQDTWFATNVHCFCNTVCCLLGCIIHKATQWAVVSGINATNYKTLQHVKDTICITNNTVMYLLNRILISDTILKLASCAPMHLSGIHMWCGASKVLVITMYRENRLIEYWLYKCLCPTRHKIGHFEDVLLS